MRVIVIAVGAAIAAAGATAAAEPIDGDRIDQTMERSLDRVYQRDLPGFDSGGATGDARLGPDGLPIDDGRGGADRGGSGSGASRSGSGGDGGALGRDGRIDRSRGGTPGDPRARRREWVEQNDQGQSGAFGGLATVLLWVLLGVAVVLLIVVIAREATGMKGAEEPVKTADAADDSPERLAAVVERPRDDADQLAHEGRFAEAIHVLLLHTLHELASQNLVRVTQAMTSREVLARVPLLGDARSALAGLVSAVELTWFGDDVPGAPDYQRCREQFQMFATAYRRGAATAGARA